MRSASAPPSRAALQRTHGKRMPQIVQPRAAHSPRLDASPADQPVEGLFDRDVAKCQTTLVDEHRIIVRARPATRQVAFQARCCRVVQWRQSRLAELGLADQQAVAGHVGDSQPQGFADPQPGGREQGDQGRKGKRAQAAPGPKPQRSLDEAIDLVCRVDVRRAAPLASAEVIGRRQFMPGILNLDMAHEAADGFEPCIALCHGWPECRPVDGRLRLHVRLCALGREGGKALQQVLRIRHREARGAAQGEIGLDGVQHHSDSGQG